MKLFIPLVKFCVTEAKLEVHIRQLVDIATVRKRLTEDFCSGVFAGNEG